MGIKPKDIDKLFEPYYLVDNQHKNTKSGSGIGMYICAEIIQHHKGRLWVENKESKGPTFSFSLPLAVNNY